MQESKLNLSFINTVRHTVRSQNQSGGRVEEGSFRLFSCWKVETSVCAYEMWQYRSYRSFGSIFDAPPWYL